MDLIPGFDLTRHNTLGLPSRAHLGATIAATAEIEELTRLAASENLPLHILGGGSNIVLRPEVPAVVGIMAAKGRDITPRADGSVLVTAQAGEDWSEFVAFTVGQGLSGLENLGGIPGTVGAAPVQNIGAYGVELADRFESLTVWDTVDRTRRSFTRNDCSFSYRQSRFKQEPGRYIVLDVTLALPARWTPVLSYPPLDKLPPGTNAAEIHQHVLAVRASKLPDWRLIGNAGSFFHNPIVAPAVADTIPGVPRFPQPDGTVKLSAGWLIDSCCLKGTREGKAGIYEKHALVLVNHGGATYADISRLATRVRETVHARYGVTLTQEPLEL
jgi:UDP-N-acetylmuramate dehydrogenase